MKLAVVVTADNEMDVDAEYVGRVNERLEFGTDMLEFGEVKNNICMLSLDTGRIVRFVQTTVLVMFVKFTLPFVTVMFTKVNSDGNTLSNWIILIFSVPELLIVTLKTIVWFVSGTNAAGVKVSTTAIGRLMAEVVIWYDSTVVLL